MRGLEVLTPGMIGAGFLDGQSQNAEFVLNGAAADFAAPVLGIPCNIQVKTNPYAKHFSRLHANGKRLRLPIIVGPAIRALKIKRGFKLLLRQQSIRSSLPLRFRYE